MNGNSSLITLLFIALIAFAIFYAFRLTITIEKLLRENVYLKQAINNLTNEEIIGYAKIKAIEEHDGKRTITCRFVETGRNDNNQIIHDKEFTLEGEEIYFDILVVKFENQLVMEGKEKALYIWRRIFSDKTPAEKGLEINTPGKEVNRYRDVFERLSIKERELLWSELWKLSNDPMKLKELGVQAITGKAAYKKFEVGRQYKFLITNTGGFNIESDPAL